MLVFYKYLLQTQAFYILVVRTRDAFRTPLSLGFHFVALRRCYCANVAQMVEQRTRNA